MADPNSVPIVLARINTPKSWTPQELEALNRNFFLIQELLKQTYGGTVGPVGPIGPPGASGITDHGLLTGLGDDDHTQYQLRSEKDIALGYPSLDAVSMIPVNELANTTIGGGGPTVHFLRQDRVWAVPSGGGSGGGVALNVAVDFGSTFSQVASTVVTGQTWVAATTKLVAGLQASTAASDDGIVHGFSALISDLVVGTGFTLTVFADAAARGTYNFSCVGV